MGKPLKIAGHTFDCVPLQEADFLNRAAVYVVVCEEKGKFFVIDVGQTGQLDVRIDEHERKGCWTSECSNGKIWVCVRLMPSSDYEKKDREELEGQIRSRYKPPCGKR